MEKRKARLAINGFGRIGRALARIAARDPNCAFDVVAINDLVDVQALAYLMRYDSVHGRFELPVTANAEGMTIDGKAVRVVAERDPASLPWGQLGVDIVVECTGRFRKRSQAAAHLAAGAGRVVISAPGDKKDPPDATVVCGINDRDIGPEHRILSAASCTTTCLAPVAVTLDDAFGIESGWMTTVHAYTNDQALVDVPHTKDARRGRNAAGNIVPTSTGAAQAIGLVVPRLAGKLSGAAIRVPTPDVSLVDLLVKTRKPVTPDAVNAALSAASESFDRGVMRMEHDPVVSSDLIGESTGAVIDAALTTVPGENLAHVVAWYDNEWGYASRLYALLNKLASQSTEG
ncbi:MAG: type I glyceraldehyde-3-phosphate dehydrogenase [Deltaproteobacteria bacterium]|nr:type I glyceraldehyde-3-phosphate dehydrogenase [Deltaproteobacteria bacterium]